MTLNKILLELKNEITTRTLKNKLVGNLSNIKIVDDLKVKAPQGVISKDEKINAQCKNDNKTFTLTANELDTYKKNANNKTGEVNPCPIENRKQKDYNKLSKDEKQEGETGKRDGNFDSIEESYIYRIIVDYMNKNKNLFPGCKLYPNNGGYGDKKKLDIKAVERNGKPAKGAHKLDADIYIEFPQQIVNGFKNVLGHEVFGHIFMVDGPTHYGPSVKYKVFSADQARDLQSQYFVTRLETRDVGKDWKKYDSMYKSTDLKLKLQPENATHEKIELNNLKQRTIEGLKKTGSALVNLTRNPKAKINSSEENKNYSHDVSKSDGTQMTAKGIERQNSLEKTQNQLERIIFNLKNREHTTPYRDLEDKYISNKKASNISDLSSTEFGRQTYEYLKNSKNRYPEKTEDFLKAIINFSQSNEKKLSAFLRTPKGKESYKRYPQLWGNVVDMSASQLKAWKEKYQAKDGEPLFNDKNLKLFEDKQ